MMNIQRLIAIGSAILLICQIAKAENKNIECQQAGQLKEVHKKYYCYWPGNFCKNQSSERKRKFMGNSVSPDFSKTPVFSFACEVQEGQSCASDFANECFQASKNIKDDHLANEIRKAPLAGADHGSDEKKQVPNQEVKQ